MKECDVSSIIRSLLILLIICYVPVLAADSPLTIKGIPEYADADAAIADGLEPGAFFRTGTLLKVVLPLSCPDSAPSNGTACDPNIASCTYGDTVCDCDGFAGNYVWDCSTCPQTQPSSGDSCTGVGSTCDYDNTSCFCSPQNDQWICF